MKKLDWKHAMNFPAPDTSQSTSGLYPNHSPVLSSIFLEYKSLADNGRFWNVLMSKQWQHTWIIRILFQDYFLFLLPQYEYFQNSMDWLINVIPWGYSGRGEGEWRTLRWGYMVDGLHIPIWNRTFCNCCDRDEESFVGRTQWEPCDQYTI
jgi:hypothetical protein